MKTRQIVTIILFHLLATSAYANKEHDKWVEKLNPMTWFSSQKKIQDATIPPTLESFLADTIEGKRAKRIQEYMLDHAKRFKNIDQSTVSLVREGQVMKVNIPMNHLFLPNDTTISAHNADNVLYSLLTFLRKGTTDMIVVAHWDNQGSDTYKKMITHKRVQSVYNWFVAKKEKESILATYSFADERPLFDNSTMLNRAMNRRVTFYFIPNKEMLKRARRNKL